MEIGYLAYDTFNESELYWLNTEPDQVLLVNPDPEVFDDQINVDIKFNFFKI